MTPAGPAVRVRRVTTTRAGGVSAAPYDSFNLGDHVGDDPVAVVRNRELLATRIGVAPAHVVWMEQIHSRTIVRVDGPQDGPVEACDGIVTTTPGLALAVLTADCVPLLMSDDVAGVVAAVHAGRVGARAGIVDKAVEAMVDAGAEVSRIGVLLGPAASGRRYEVPPAMQADVDRVLPGSASTTAEGTTGLDLRAGIRRRLETLGVAAVAVDPRCTIEDRTLFSHRRGAPTGRLASVVWMEPNA